MVFSHSLFGCNSTSPAPIFPLGFHAITLCYFAFLSVIAGTYRISYQSVPEGPRTFNTIKGLDIHKQNGYTVHMRTEQILKTLGSNIRAIREKRGTQQDLANTINKDRSVIARYERGEVDIPVTVLFDIAKALKVSAAKLVK